MWDEELTNFNQHLQDSYDLSLFVEKAGRTIADEKFHKRMGAIAVIYFVIFTALVVKIVLEILRR